MEVMMRLRSLALSTLLLFACSTAAFAAKPAPEIVPLDGDFQSVTSGHPAPNGACTMGVSTGAAFIINYIVPPNDQYYTLIDPSNCSCPNGSIAVNAAHLLLNFQANCAQPVAVTIVPAVDVNGCLQPDASAPICGPFLFNLTP